MTVALITGVTGQDGSYLAEFLLNRGYRVIGMIRRSSTLDFQRIAQVQDRIEIVQGDLTDQGSLFQIVETYRPDEVYNLGGQSNVHLSWGQVALTGESTALGVARLLDSLHQLKPETRFYQASTSEIFGAATESPQNERSNLNPRNPYGVAKVYGHLLARNYREHFGMFAVSGILYNHESPRRGLDFVTRKITHGAVRIKLGITDKLHLGNLDCQRDWGFAGDYVKAMWLMLQQTQPNDYVIGTGQLHSVREFCKTAFEILGLNYEDYVVQDERFYQPAETFPLKADFSYARQTLNWEPEVDFESLVNMMVEADMHALEKEV